LADHDCHVLVVDDASTDRTHEIGQEYRREHPELPMTVLKNAMNQGYGGNQKVGYAFAIKEGFDFVAMVHGDGQYAPEALPMLLQPLTSGEADAVFGSRMIEPRAALKGGMPLYKYVGNKILTRFQNALTGLGLSEFHSGYRLYRVATLARLPLQLNTNDFHFDTEIILQLANAKAKIVEMPIPTYYGDEICRVNGIAYARDVAIATVKNSLHRVGLLYQRRFDTAPTGNAHYELKLGYASSHTYALDAVPNESRVIDIGAGPGGMAKALLKKGCDVTVIDHCEPDLQRAGVRVLVRDLDLPLPKGALKGADHLLLLDVIEHLRDPERFLADLREHFDFSPRTLVLTTPNVAFIVQRLMLLAGQFNYGKAGILDRTHTRLFTFNSLNRLLSDHGFVIKEVKGVPAPFAKAIGNNAAARALSEMNLALIRVSKTLFSYQIFVVAECKPSVDFVLEHAREHTENVPLSALN
jgi:2-polyprenyl-3-methyl-5-hydroxy-6-metoxy-1,4-benzoquinol methylase